jgi:hypothetical protein
MKQIFFSVIIGLTLIHPVYSAQTAVTQEELNAYITGLGRSTSTQNTTLSPELQTLLNSFTANGQQLSNDYTTLEGIRRRYPDINEEDERYLLREEGQSLEDYMKRIQIENLRRQALGQTNLLPNPFAPISTTQIPDNNGRIPTPWNPIPPATTDPSTWLAPTIARNSTNIPILDQIVNPSKLGALAESPLNKLLNQLFYIGLVGAVILAIVMIIRGGIEYMTIDAIASKENGKRRVQAALGGLVLAFSAILILNTINPGLTSLSIKFDELKSITQAGITSSGLTSGTRPDGFGGNDYSTINNAITPTGDGYEITPGRVAIDTDGTERPPFNDPHWQNQTSLAGLNANTDNYVVVPIGSTIPLGTKVQMYNETTGKTAWGIVGDRGPSPNGYGEISLNAARELGAWTDGMGNAANQHKIKYTYYTNEKK